MHMTTLCLDVHTPLCVTPFTVAITCLVETPVMAWQKAIPA